MGITSLLQEFQGIISGGYVKTLPYAKVLLGILITLDITFWGIKFAATGGAKSYEIIKKVAMIGALFYVINNFPYLVTSFVNSLVEGGFIAGGSKSSWELLHDPGEILNMAIDALSPVEKAIHKLPGRKVGEILMYGVLYILILASFCLVTITVFFTMIQFYLFVGISGLLIPWISVKQGRFIGEKLVSGVLHFGIQLMVLAFILAITNPMLQKIMETQAVDLKKGVINSTLLVSLLVFALAMAILILKGPSLMSSLLTGNPSFSGAGSMVGAVAGSVIAGKNIMAGSGALTKSGGGTIASIAQGAGKGAGEVLRGAGSGVGSALQGVGGGIGRAIHNPYKKGSSAERGTTGSGMSSAHGQTKSSKATTSSGGVASSMRKDSGASAGTFESAVTSPIEKGDMPDRSDRKIGGSQKSLREGISDSQITDVEALSWGAYDTPLAGRNSQQLLLPVGSSQQS